MPPSDTPPAVPSSLADRAALLRFYADSGVDCMLAAAAIDRFEESRAARAERPGPIIAPPPLPGAASTGPDQTATRRQTAADSRSAHPSPPSSTRPATPAVPDETAIANTRSLARSARTIAELRDILADFDGCGLKFSAKSLVFADGNPEADVMFIGEAPGRDEDLQGLPFVGRAGQMLDRMLAAIGRDRASVYITNMIFWRPPGNRTPTPHEVALCRPFTERHIELADPKLIVFLGNVATKGMLETTRGIMSLRGSWTDYRVGERTLPALPTLHPAYLLRNPAHKKLAWKDFLDLSARLDTIPHTG